MPRSLLLGLVLTSACGAPVSRSRSAITGGDPESGYLAVFSLAYMGQGSCSGTCITPKVGITAAHCIQPGDAPSSLSALFGDDERQPSSVVGVAAYEIHDTADIALVEFADACPAAIPYNFTALEGHEGEPVVMVGFGVTIESANDAGIKRSGTATLFSVNPAEVRGLEAGELATSNDPDGTCNGDSGGPTFMTFDGVEYMVGVTSRGSLDDSGNEYPCGQGRSIAVRADSYAGFIDAFIQQHDPSMPPPTDAGVEPDGGAAIEMDAGSAPDASAGGKDAAAGRDATVEVDEESGGGCGCSVRSDLRARGVPFLLLLLCLAVRQRSPARRLNSSR